MPLSHLYKVTLLTAIVCALSNVIAIPVSISPQAADTLSSIVEEINTQYMHNPGAHPPWPWYIGSLVHNLLEDIQDDNTDLDSNTDDNSNGSELDANQEENLWSPIVYSPIVSLSRRQEEYLEDFPMLTVDKDDSSSLDEYPRHTSLDRRASMKWYPMAHRHIFVHRPSLTSLSHTDEEEASENTASTEYAMPINDYRWRSSANRGKGMPIQQADVVDMSPKSAPYHVSSIVRRWSGTQRFLLNDPQAS
ncbi:hypothetical protein BDF22DRAFT_684309 [Syncephalis plumigaleata]|nr:hypothetical protein BDF22DRAFT_684309 [Syncephalis plumigaleata]